MPPWGGGISKEIRNGVLLRRNGGPVGKVGADVVVDVDMVNKGAIRCMEYGKVQGGWCFTRE